MRGAIQCSVCGGRQFRKSAILWRELIDDWQISDEEAFYIDRQQGERCTTCYCNLRSIALASAIKSCLGYYPTLTEATITDVAKECRVLELNEAGDLHAVLARMPLHTFGAYPEVDMHKLPYPDDSFDLVVHSDTLEHIPNPVHALQECRRILKPRGHLCFTVPVIVGRMSRSREGLKKSYHGDPSQSGDDYVVQTEFGADFWTFPVRAGFSEPQIFSLDFPAALAIKVAKPCDVRLPS